MLPEIVLYATAETTGPMRRLGLVGDAVALWSRATRQRQAWAPHEARCHGIVDEATAGLARRNTALVLGSGLLRDVPLAFLLERFERVILVDAVHLWPARWRSRDPRVTRVVADLTGIGVMLSAGRDRPDDVLGRFRADPTIDFVLSANVLSQMPMAVERWTERHPGAATRLPGDLARTIVASHLQDLAAFDARICLLTDTRHREIARDGTMLDETDLLRGETLPEPDDAWNWEVAPLGEVSRRAAHVHRVHGYRDFAASLARML
jgi:hypothetical protein